MVGRAAANASMQQVRDSLAEHICALRVDMEGQLREVGATRAQVLEKLQTITEEATEATRAETAKNGDRIDPYWPIRFQSHRRGCGGN
jgi:hypothetical protein